MSEYDSILKEKKKYEEPVIKDDSPKKFPWFKVDILLLSILLIIGYIIYYNTILTPELIFFNDIKLLVDKYENIFLPLELDNLKADYSLIGNINYEDKVYDFEIDKINRQTNFSLSLDSQNLNYYANLNENYIKLSNDEKYYNINKNDYFNMIINLKEYFMNNLSKDKFIKKFYLNDTIPVVESSLVLDNNDIIEAIKPNYYDGTYEVLFTFKNNAIKNEIISMKMVVNNLMTNERMVLIYENDYLTYMDDNVNFRIELEEDEDNYFKLNFYQNDNLFSVLTGTMQENSYQYTYQLIDEIYNIYLTISKDSDIYNYELKSIIGEIDNESKMNISFQYADPFIENDISNSVNYNSLTKEEKDLYKTNVDNILSGLREFIKKYY